MKTSMKTLIAAALATTALFTALPASADNDRWDRHDRGEWRDDHPGRGHGWGHHRYWGPRYEERVVIRERPVYRDYYYPAPVYPAPVYYAPPPVRYYPRNPAIVIGVDVPPLVIPLR